MRTAAFAPLDPGHTAAGIARILPDRIQRDEHAMEALGSLVGYLFHAAGLELK